MAQSNEFVQTTEKREIFRVIDNGSCSLTTDNPYKALITLKKLIEKYDITHCWVDVEELK